LCLAALAWAEPQLEMHRIGATTKDPSGWYLAASTHGTFSVLIPIPFNDFTGTVESSKVGKIKTHIVGAKSAEGIEFTATETPIMAGKSPTNLASMPEQFSKPGHKVSDIDTSLFGGYPSVSFSVKGPSGGAYIRYVKTAKSFILVLMEYPKDQARTAQEFGPTFLSSLKIKEAAKDGVKGEKANPNRVGTFDRAETNRASSTGPRR
jgi:hypothetical protein